jgi:pyruvate kinase
MVYNAIVTMPPYAPYMREVLRHPIVSGIRLNTVMALHDSIDDTVRRMQEEATRHGKRLWIDLKGRQLRTAGFGVPPFTEIELTHNIDVKTPVTAYFSDGKEHATVLAVKGNKLYMQEGPRRVVGPGESINIPHPSLRIDGYFTRTDIEYIEAAQRVGLQHYMLSFVESQQDVAALKSLHPDAIVASKIESMRGLDYVKSWDGHGRLMAARGDLYLEVPRPHLIASAVASIVEKDPDAIAASRILDSLALSSEPSCADIGDLDSLVRMGYRTFMFGDHICLERDSIISGLNLLQEMAKDHR